MRDDHRGFGVLPRRSCRSSLETEMACSGTDMKNILVNATEARIETRIDSFWRNVETSIYVAAACIIAVTAAMALSGCGFALWQGFHTWNSWDTIVRVIDILLLVLMLVEILHTVRISIRSHVLVAEPFLIVGLIATIRRILVIGLEAGNLSRPETWNPERQTLFRTSVIELGLLGLLVLILVTAIYLLRRSQPSSD
jgi:uncharacterized membrane protein (DUF373 family)